MSAAALVGPGAAGPVRPRPALPIGGATVVGRIGGARLQRRRHPAAGLHRDPAVLDGAGAQQDRENEDGECWPVHVPPAMRRTGST
jgi:hypothetical protein